MSEIYKFPALILAGGFGTRLRPAIGQTQKAIAPVGQKSFLYYQLKNWYSQGIRNYIFLLHYQANSVIKLLESDIEAQFPNLSIKYVVEDEALGTGGSVLNTVQKLKIDTPFWVFNADTWVPNFVTFFSFQSMAQVGVCKVDDCRRYGTVKFNRNHFVTKFIEKSDLQTPAWVNAGVNLLHEENFKHCNERIFSLEEHILKPIVADQKLKAVPLDDGFIDIGVPDDYLKFQHKIRASND